MKLAIVFVSYLKVPEERLQDHFRWNREAYKQFGDRLRVYVVSDIDHDLPSYAESVIYPMDRLPMIDGRRRFSLTATKNSGIAEAIENGAEVVISTDVDVAFDPQTLQLMFTVPDDWASIPLYRMAPSFEDRAKGHIDHGCMGTVGLTAANWTRIRYDERCVGYGADDGILMRDIERAGIRIARDHEVTHIAHVSGDGARQPGRGSATCWGRDDGFNFDNFTANRRLHQTGCRRCRR
jgi:hypothetical protein